MNTTAIATPSRMHRHVLNRYQWLGVGLIAAWAMGWRVDPVASGLAWLAAWWFCLSLSLGALTHLWLHRLTGGVWGERTADTSRWLAGRLPWVLLAALPWLWQAQMLYPWASPQDSAGLQDAMDVARPAFRHLWFTPATFFARLMVYAVVWLALWHFTVRRPASKGGAALGLIIHAIVTSLAAVDLIMALMPRWYSSGFGLLILVAQSLGSWAMVTWIRTRSQAGRHAENAPDAPDSPPWRDLGNLLLMFVMSWAYLSFMEFLIIWAENLPAEIAWYLPRMHGGWGVVSLVVVVGQWALPQLCLLWRSLKDSPRLLGWSAGAVLAAHALYAAWLVVPSVAPGSPHAWWLLLLAFAGLISLVFGGMAAAPERLDHGA